MVGLKTHQHFLLGHAPCLGACQAGGQTVVTGLEVALGLFRADPAGNLGIDVGLPRLVPRRHLALRADFGMFTVPVREIGVEKCVPSLFPGDQLVVHQTVLHRLGKQDEGDGSVDVGMLAAQCSDRKVREALGYRLARQEDVEVEVLGREVQRAIGDVERERRGVRRDRLHDEHVSHAQGDLERVLV